MSGKRCRQCGGLNPEDASWCGQCLTRFAAPPPPPPPPTPVQQPGAIAAIVEGRVSPATALAGTPFAAGPGGATWTCQMCRHTNPIQLDACSSCGVPFRGGLEFAQGPRLPTIMPVGGGRSALVSLPARGRMSFAERVNKGFSLLALSWRALRLDPELMVIPVLSMIAGLAIGAGLLGAVGGLEFSRWGDPEAYVKSEPLLWTYYFFMFAVGIYCQAAIVAAAMIRFSGGNPTVADGFKAAFTKIVPLTLWAAIACTVAMIIRALEERFSRWITTPAALAWASVSYFVIPVIVCESLGAGAALKRSGTLFRRNWGQTLIGGVGLSVAIGLIMVAMMIAAVLIMAVVHPAIGLVVGIVGLVVIAIVGSTLAAIFNAALYRYAVSGDAPIPFAVADLRHAFPAPIVSPAPAGAPA